MVSSIPRLNQSRRARPSAERTGLAAPGLLCIELNIPATATASHRITCDNIECSIYHHSQPHLLHLLWSDSQRSHPTDSEVPLDDEHDGLVVCLEHVTPWDGFIGLL